MVLVALVTMALPMLAIAEDDVAAPPESQEFKGEKFFDLALCAVSLAAAPSGLGVWVAGLTCGKAFYVWFSE